MVRTIKNGFATFTFIVFSIGTICGSQGCKRNNAHTETRHMRTKPTESDGDINYRNAHWLRFLQPAVQKENPEAVEKYAQAEQFAKGHRWDEALKAVDQIQPVDHSPGQQIYLGALQWTAEGLARDGQSDRALQTLSHLAEPTKSFALSRIVHAVAGKGNFDKARAIMAQIQFPEARRSARKGTHVRQVWMESYDEWCRRLISEPESREVLAWLKSGDNTLGEISSAKRSLALAQDIYDHGAVKVFALDIDEYPSYQNTGILVIELPQNPAARAKVSAWAAKHTRSQDDLEEGQKYLFVMLD